MKIAETLMEEKKFAEASKELRTLASKHRTNIQVMNLLAWSLLNSGDIAQAFTTWQRCMKLDPKNYSVRESMIKARLELGKKCRASGQFTPALVHFKELLKILPKSPEVLHEIAQTYAAKGDLHSAYRHFKMVIQLDPKNRDAKKALSDMRLRGG